MRILVISLLAVLPGACGSPPDPAPADPLVAEGAALARQHCVSCHAIGPRGRSTHPDAIAFRDISKSYPVSALEESFAEGVMVGHPDMPEFRFGPGSLRALIAYLESVQDK